MNISAAMSKTGGGSEDVPRASGDSADAGSAAASDTSSSDTVTSSALEWMHHLPGMCRMLTSHVHVVN